MTGAKHSPLIAMAVHPIRVDRFLLTLSVNEEQWCSSGHTATIPKGKKISTMLAPGACTNETCASDFLQNPVLQASRFATEQSFSTSVVRNRQVGPLMEPHLRCSNVATLHKMENSIKMVDKMNVAKDELSHRRFYFRYFRVDRKSRKWGMYVTTCGRSVILPEDGSYPPRQHPPLYHFDWEHGRELNEYQLVYIPEGSGLFETKKEKIQIRGATAILLRPGLWHRYAPKPETGWREYWVGFSGPAYKAIFDARFFPEKSIYRVRDSSGMHQAFESLIACAQENGPALQQTMAAHTCLLLARLYSSTLMSAPTANEASKMVQRARELMLAAEMRDISLADLARRLGTSYSNFRRTFCEHTGVGPHQYRLHLKLLHACDLLLKTELPVKEIAFQSGFQEEQYFCRFFKKAMGKTPSEYRIR